MSTLKILNHPADRRTMIWSILFFPALPLVGLTFPDWVYWLIPLSLYLAFCAGVLTHYHNHRKVLIRSWMNDCYSVWLSIFYGFPIFAWVPTHNLNHHRFLNGPRDATSTNRRQKRDSLYEALTYPTRSSIWQAPALRAYLRRLRRQKPLQFRWAMIQIVAVLAFQGGSLALFIGARGVRIGIPIYLSLVFLPALFAPWSMMFINYLQHVGCESDSPDNHSRNFVGLLENWFIFDAGFHTVHHEFPRAHFSEYRKLHAGRAQSIHPSLNQRNVWAFLFRRYVLRTTVINPHYL